MQRALVDPDTPVSSLLDSFVENMKAFAVAGTIGGAASLLGAAAAGRARASAYAAKEMGRGVDETTVPPYTATAHEFLEGPIWDLPASEFSRVPDEPRQGEANGKEQSVVQPAEQTELGARAQGIADGGYVSGNDRPGNAGQPGIDESGQVGVGQRNGGLPDAGTVDHDVGRGQQAGIARREPGWTGTYDGSLAQGQVEPGPASTELERAIGAKAATLPEPPPAKEPVALSEHRQEPVLGSLSDEDREPQAVKHRDEDKLESAGFKRLGDRIVGAPPEIKSWRHVDEQINEMVTRAEDNGLATDQDWHWYRDAGHAAADLAQSPQELEHLVRLIALTSADNSVQQNAQDAVSGAYALARGQEPKVGRYPDVMGRRIPALLAAPEMSRDIPGVGPKVLNFYRNIMDEAQGTNKFPRHSTVDRHMVALFWPGGIEFTFRA